MRSENQAVFPSILQDVLQDGCVGRMKGMVNFWALSKFREVEEQSYWRRALDIRRNKHQVENKCVPVEKKNVKL